MPPPASFIEISAVPFTQLVTQAMFNVANEQWFKYTATVPIVIGIQNNEGGTFSPRIRIYEADGTTLYHGPVNLSTGWWFPLRTAAVYYIQVVRGGVGGPTDFDFTFNADTRPLDIISVVAGDIIVNDDSASEPLGWPAAVISVAGEIKFFISAIPSGEKGAILPSNVSIWHDPFARIHATRRVAVFDENFAYITSVDVGIGVSVFSPTFATDIIHDKFYVINWQNELWTISNTGVETDTTYVFPGVNPEVAAVSPDGTKLYWTNITEQTGVIHTFDLDTLTPLADFHTIAGFVPAIDFLGRTPNNHGGDMFALPDGKVVAWWNNGAATIYHLIVINSAGTLLFQHDFAAPTRIDHLAYIDGDSDNIAIWLYTDNLLEFGRFGILNLATGVISEDSTLDLFTSGTNFTGTDMFGPSTSCTFVRVQSIDISGIYFIDPTANEGTGIPILKHDVYRDEERKIPNPTVKTALLGE